MTAPRTESLHSRLETLIALARLLERVEASPIAIGADPYRALVGQLKAALAAPLPAAPLQAILSAHPATGIGRSQSPPSALIRKTDVSRR